MNNDEDKKWTKQQAIRANEARDRWARIFIISFGAVCFVHYVLLISGQLVIFLGSFSVFSGFLYLLITHIIDSKERDG